MSRKECGKHQKGIEDIINRLENESTIDWKTIGNNMEYGINIGFPDERTIGELDVYAIACRPSDGSRMVIFEYKCNDGSRSKAENQLSRAKDWYSRRGYDVSTFYCYGDPVKYEMVI